jgi:hypothetical protein
MGQCFASLNGKTVWLPFKRPSKRNCLSRWNINYVVMMGIKEENLLHRCEKVREKAILRRRALIETVFDELKNLCQIEHTRHRSAANFVVNLMAGIMAYCLSDNKPSLSLIRVNLLPQA